MKFRLRQSISEGNRTIYVLEYTTWLLDWRHTCSVKWNCIIKDSSDSWYVDFDYAYEALEKCKSWEAKFIS